MKHPVQHIKSLFLKGNRDFSNFSKKSLKTSKVDIFEENNL